MIEEPRLFRLHPDSLDVRLRDLTLLLELRGRWMKREDLARQLGWSVRIVRDTASHSRGTILSGQRGLILTRLASVADANESRAALISQAKQMLKRAGEIAKVQHELISSRRNGAA